MVVDRKFSMHSVRLLVAIIHDWTSIIANEASHACHTGKCIDERHAVLESVLLNAERCRKGWQVCEHFVPCTNCKPLAE